MKQERQAMHFTVIARSEVWPTQKGNLYLECDTDHGTVAFWGKSTNTRNIDAVEAQTLPVLVDCETIGSNWPQHRFWVMEGARLKFTSVQQTPVAAAVIGVTADELNQWRRRLLRLLEKLFGQGAPKQGPISRITELKRDSKIPRKTAALMIAVTEVRNAAEHPGDMPTAAEAAAARSAWEAVTDWAVSKGVDPNSL
jgi:hypothetical protein